MMDRFRKGSELELTIEKLALGGPALARVEGFVVFVERAIPGQRVRVRIVRKKRQFAMARVIELQEQSPHWVAPFCPHFGTCGGCSWQDLAYEQQLHWKRQQVVESLQHLAGIKDTTVHPAVASPVLTGYRNKMEFTFSPRHWHETPPDPMQACQTSEPLALGLHVRGFHDAILNLRTCLLSSPEAASIMVNTRSWCQQNGLPAYSTKGHEGFWRFLVIREAKTTQDMLVHVITSSQGDPGVVSELVRYLLVQHPCVTSVVHSVSDSKAQVAMGEHSRCLHGPGFIEEQLHHVRYRISAHSFFQTNTLGANHLYDSILRLGQFTGGETVWDLYCGTGSIALFIAAHVRRVIGFELSPDAVADARQNCELNAIDHCSFVCGDMKDMARSLDTTKDGGGAPDVVITDPPRAGMHPHVTKALLDLAPPIIIAVSCNPATLARDLQILLERYRVDEIQPFDMFPHTPHIECVVKLTRQ
jgi:23S rRNA (uracil1939-C5)-methyltransferase